VTRPAGAPAAGPTGAMPSGQAALPPQPTEAGAAAQDQRDAAASAAAAAGGRRTGARRASAPSAPAKAGKKLEGTPVKAVGKAVGQRAGAAGQVATAKGKELASTVRDRGPAVAKQAGAVAKQAGAAAAQQAGTAASAATAAAREAAVAAVAPAVDLTAVERKVLAVRGVVRLAPDLRTQAEARLPGHVGGLSVNDDSLSARLVARFGERLPELAERVHSTLEQFAEGRPTFVEIADVEIAELAPPTPRRSRRSAGTPIPGGTP